MQLIFRFLVSPNMVFLFWLLFQIYFFKCPRPVSSSFCQADRVVTFLGWPAGHFSGLTSTFFNYWLRIVGIFDLARFILKTDDLKLGHKSFFFFFFLLFSSSNTPSYVHFLRRRMSFLNWSTFSWPFLWHTQTRSRLQKRLPSPKWYFFYFWPKGVIYSFGLDCKWLL